jgi:hypothetical protein
LNMNLSDENTNREKIDRWLDAALPHFSEADPRVGLEARVLATLASDRREREQNRYRWPWRLALAAALAAVVIVVIARAPWRSGQPPVVTERPTTPGAPAGTESPPPVVTGVTSNPALGTNGRRNNPHLRAVVGGAPAPRLAQFPAPRPLSEQERLLVALVDNSSSEQLAQDAALQQRLRKQVEEAQISDGGMLEPRGK